MLWAFPAVDPLLSFGLAHLDPFNLWTLALIARGMKVLAAVQMRTALTVVFGGWLALLFLIAAVRF